MKYYRIQKKLFIPIPIEEAWDYFSNPKNLKEITPDYMKFKITCSIPEKVVPGLIITYKIYPFPFIPVNWMTEITHLNELEYFVDEQRLGPYRVWHHRHIFHSTDEGTIMEDIVDYVLPLGIIGKLVHYFFVDKQVNDIFDYREKKLIELFNNRNSK